MLEEKNLLCWQTSSGHCESESVETKQMSSILGNLSKILALDNVQTQCLIDCFCHPTLLPHARWFRKISERLPSVISEKGSV